MRRWLNLRASMAQFSHTIAGQVRLDIEAEHLRLFRRVRAPRREPPAYLIRFCAQNFRSWRDVDFPRPIEATESVIVETFESGEVGQRVRVCAPLLACR